MLLTVDELLFESQHCSLVFDLIPRGKKLRPHKYFYETAVTKGQFLSGFKMAPIVVYSCVLVLVKFGFYSLRHACHLTWNQFTLILSKSFYNIFFHPLRRYPGPWYCSISNIWYSFHSSNGRLARKISSLHERYGHVVRIAPKEL